MNASNAFISQYLEDVLRILESASAQSLSTSQFLEDEEMLDYLQRLRETLIECYTTIVHGVKQSSYTRPLIQRSQNIFTFLQSVCDKVHSPSRVKHNHFHNYFQAAYKSVLGLIGDIADCIGADIKNLLQTPFVEQLILMMQNTNDQECKDVAAWTLKQIRAV